MSKTCRWFQRCYMILPGCFFMFPESIATASFGHGRWHGLHILGFHVACQDVIPTKPVEHDRNLDSLCLRIIYCYPICEFRIYFPQLEFSAFARCTEGSSLCILYITLCPSKMASAWNQKEPLKHSQKQKNFLTAAKDHLSSLPRPENTPHLHKQTDRDLSCERSLAVILMMEDVELFARWGSKF